MALGGVMAMAGGCGVVTTQGAAPATSAATVVRETASASISPRPRCGTPSASALAAVDATVRAAGEGNRLPKAWVLADPDSRLWLIAGVFMGPAGEVSGRSESGLQALIPPLIRSPERFTRSMTLP